MEGDVNSLSHNLFYQNLPTPVLSVSGARVRSTPSQPNFALSALTKDFGTPDFLCGFKSIFIDDEIIPQFCSLVKPDRPIS